MIIKHQSLRNTLPLIITTPNSLKKIKKHSCSENFYKQVKSNRGMQPVKDTEEFLHKSTKKHTAVSFEKKRKARKQ